MSTTIRVSEQTRDRFARLAEATGRPMSQLLDEAADALERRVFFEELRARSSAAPGRPGALGGAPGRTADADRPHPFGMIPRRGEIWLVAFGGPEDGGDAGGQPAVVVSADALNGSLAGVILAVPLTSRRRGLPSHIEIAPGPSGLEGVGYAKCEELRSVTEERLISPLGVVSGETMRTVARVLGMLLDL